jgi:predicted dehydrogenase
MRTFGVAVVGTGFIGPVHVEALRRLGQDVRGILGSTPEKSRQAAQALHLPRGYGDLQELLDDAEVQVVHLTSPNRHHFEQCCRVLAAGKHLVCEKPLAMNSQETTELVRLAQVSNLVTAVNYNVRFYPLCLEARERVRAGKLGKLFHVNGSYLQDWLLYDTDFNWRVQSEEGGDLRAIADIGTHWLDLISFITGAKVMELCADLKTVHPVRHSPQGSVETFQAATRKIETIPVSISTEDYGTILLRFDDGMQGSVTVSQVCAGRKNCIRFDLAGSEGSLSWNSEEPNSLLIGQRNRANELLIRDPSLLASEVQPFANYPGGHAEGFPDSFKQLFRSIYQTIDSGSPGRVPYPSFADGHREVLLCEAVLRSAREKRWVNVDGNQ